MNTAIIVFLAFCAGIIVGGLMSYQAGYQVGVIDASKAKGGK